MKTGNTIKSLLLTLLITGVAACGRGNTQFANLPYPVSPQYGTLKNTEAKDPNFLTFFSNTYDGDPKIAQEFKDNPDKRFIKFVRETKKTLDICVYEIDSVDMTDAIIEAHERGVRVRMVVDSQTNNKGNSIARLKKAGVPVVDDGGRSAYMHNKFAVADSSWVWTGSYNLTNNSSWKHNDNVIKINSREMANNYIAEFEEMFIDKKFGRTSPNNIKNRSIRFSNNKTVTTLFAPEDDVIAHLIYELSRAKKNIKFMGFSFTHDALAEILLKKARAGVEIAGIFEYLGSNNTSSVLGKLQNGKDITLYIKKPAQTQALMHHKVFIIDDRVTITGSFNFSKSASIDNDENVLIINSTEVAGAYLQEFDKVKQHSNNTR